MSLYITMAICTYIDMSIVYTIHQWKLCSEYDNKTNVYTFMLAVYRLCRRNTYQLFEKREKVLILWVLSGLLVVIRRLIPQEYFDSVNFKRAYCMEHGIKRETVSSTSLFRCAVCWVIELEGIKHAVGCFRDAFMVVNILVYRQSLKDRFGW